MTVGEYDFSLELPQCMIRFRAKPQYAYDFTIFLV